MSLFKRGEASRLTVAIILIVVVAVVSTLILTLEKKAASQQADASQKEALKAPAKEPEAKPEKTAKRSRVEKPVLVAGQIAPDFELPRLTIKTDKEGKTVGEISTETVKLSSFRGKQPVFLIFSSYT